MSILSFGLVWLVWLVFLNFYNKIGWARKITKISLNRADLFKLKKKNYRTDFLKFNINSM